MDLLYSVRLQQLKLILAVPVINTHFFAQVIRKTRRFHLAKNIFGDKLHFKKNQELPQVYYDGKKDELSYANVANDFDIRSSHRLSKLDTFQKSIYVEY